MLSDVVYCLTSLYISGRNRSWFLYKLGNGNVKQKQKKNINYQKKKREKNCDQDNEILVFAENFIDWYVKYGEISTLRLKSIPETVKTFKAMVLNVSIPRTPKRFLLSDKLYETNTRID